MGKHPGRRRGDTATRVRVGRVIHAIGSRRPEHWYRDAWLFIISVFLVIVVLNLQSTQSRVTQGRRFAVGVTCAVESSVASAGRKVIEQSSLGRDTPFVRFLEAHGYPSRTVRIAQAQAQADAYVRSIADSIYAQVGRKGVPILNPDGSLNCGRLESLSDVPPPPHVP